MGAQSLIWFGVAGGAAIFALSLLNARYIRRDTRAVRSRGSYTLFAIIMLLFALGAAGAGIAAIHAGR